MKFYELVDKYKSENTIKPSNDEKKLLGRYKDFELLLNVFKTINRSLILDDVIVLVLDNAIRIAKAERGFLLLADDKNELRTVMARDAKDRTLDADQYSISESVPKDVFETGESICVEHAQHDKLYDSRSSIVSLSLETILCSPLIVRGEKIGVIYVDSKHIQPVNRNEIINLFEILAGQAATALKNAQLYDTVTKAYHDLQNANEVLIKMDRMAIKGEMAAEVSHELKNLFNVALLQLDSLERSLARLPQEKVVDRIKEAHDSVKKIELFARGLVENSSMKVNKSLGNLNKSIGETVRLLQPLRKYRSAHIETKFDSSLPYLYFDAQQMQQLMLNLLNNAIEAHSEATLTLSTIFLADTNEVSISISDNGPGIAEEVKNKLFNEKITTKIDGHGYGLPICKKIAENHDGTIEVHSTMGKGTTFLINMPVVGA